MLLIAHEASPRGLEPVRVQKALFLLAREGDIPRDEQYRFVPYNYGPMSVGVYRDVAALVAAGLAPGQRPEKLTVEDWLRLHEALDERR